MNDTSSECLQNDDCNSCDIITVLLNEMCFLFLISSHFHDLCSQILYYTREYVEPDFNRVTDPDKIFKFCILPCPSQQYKCILFDFFFTIIICLYMKLAIIFPIWICIIHLVLLMFWILNVLYIYISTVDILVMLQ